MATHEEGAETKPVVNPWDERIVSFATAVGKTPDEITSALKPLVGEPGPDALSVLSDSQAILDSDLHGALVSGSPTIPIGVFRTHLPKLRGPQMASSQGGSGEGVTSFEAVLPNVPDDESFLASLKIGGNLKPAKTEVLSAIKAALANTVGLYALPKALSEKMEEFAERQDEPVGEDFFKLRKLVVSQSYAEVLSVLSVDSSFVSEKRKKAFFEKLNMQFWSSIKGFHDQLCAWQESWSTGVNNPAMMMMLLANTAGSGNAMPPGMMQPPETSGLRDAAESVINEINKVFAGFGIPVARALAYEATRIKMVLQEPTLPITIGAVNYEQMLKILGVEVEADFVRLERNLTRFVLAIMEFPKVPSGTQEIAYLTAMLQLGLSIPWNKLPMNEKFGAGIGGGRNSRRDGQL